MKLKKEIFQRHLEEFDKLYAEKGVPGITGLSRGAGLVVRCAIEAGWFEGEPDPKAVGDMRGGEVRKLAKDIDALYVEASTIDPNS